MMFGKDAKKSDLILNLDDIYSKLVNKYQISPGDFPELKNMKASMSAACPQVMIEWGKDVELVTLTILLNI